MERKDMEGVRDEEQIYRSKINIEIEKPIQTTQQNQLINED